MGTVHVDDHAVTFTLSIFEKLFCGGGPGSSSR